MLATALFFSTRRRRQAEQRKLNAACDTSNTAQPTLTAEQMAIVTKRRVHMLHLLVKRLTAASLPPASVPEMQALLLSNGHAPEHADSIFVMNELRCSPAVEFTKGAMKLAAKPAAGCSFQASEAMRSITTWQSKEELQLYLQQAIEAMCEVTPQQPVPQSPPILHFHCPLHLLHRHVRPLFAFSVYQQPLISFRRFAFAVRAAWSFFLC